MPNGKPKSQTMGLLIALAILNTVGFLVLYFKVDLDNSLQAGDAALLSRDLADLKMKVGEIYGAVKPKEGMMAKTTKEYTGWDLKFKYPTDWYVTQYEDAFVSRQMNVRITSQSGTLFLSAGGPGKPKASEFTLGVQIDIAELASGQDIVGGRRLQTLPTSGKGVVVQKVVGECDGAGCPAASYLVTAGTIKYHALVNIVGDDFESDLAVSEAIVTSLTK